MFEWLTSSEAVEVVDSLQPIQIVTAHSDIDDRVNGHSFESTNEQSFILCAVIGEPRYIEHPQVFLVVLDSHDQTGGCTEVLYLDTEKCTPIQMVTNGL